LLWWCVFCLRCSQFLQFLVNTKSYVRAAYYVRKSWKRWDIAYKLEKDLEKAKKPISEQLSAFISFGVGFFYFGKNAISMSMQNKCFSHNCWLAGISMVPPQMEFVVKVLGFKVCHSPYKFKQQTTITTITTTTGQSSPRV
jgi:hypothetical protein